MVYAREVDYYSSPGNDVILCVTLARELKRSKILNLNIYSLLAVGAGGFLGSVGRYLCVLYVDRAVNSYFPFGTLIVNITGSFLLGMFVGMNLNDKPEAFSKRLFLTTGFCGGFTTFSAFALESANLLQQKLTASTVVYIVVSVLISVLAVVAGVWMGRRLVTAT